jgi:hypothetical protein
LFFFRNRGVRTDEEQGGSLYLSVPWFWHLKILEACHVLAVNDFLAWGGLAAEMSLDVRAASDGV